MELKPSSYQHSEIGLIPSDWRVKQVGELCEVTTGSRNTQDRVADGDFPFFVRSQTVERINSYSFDGEAVLTAGDGVGTGKVFHYINGKFDAHQRVYRISNFQLPIDGYFFFLYFSTHFYDRIMSMTAKSSVDSVRMEMITKMAIPLPPSIAEQRAIATVLSDTDALIAGLERLIAKKRDIKLAANQKLLTGQTRLPGFSGEWEVKHFAAVLVRLNAKAHQIQTTDYQTLGRYPVVDQGKEPIVGYSDREEKCLRTPVGGVIVFGDHTCIVKFIDFDFLVGADGTQILQGKSGQCTLFHALQLQYRGVETTGYNRHFKFLKERDFVVPPLLEQIAIAAVLSDLDADLAALESRLAKTRALKQGMMQELLTGRTRLV
ncbi:restriction endonuclease subunit S [Roseateles oligotrophus]|uniref:Restriction endonuclease subunit S n=1 Tax=Roseateles oligotrophus TaxID=1769250 RepID=A0ABT2Y8F3_9BURK|nr:restriction endonuclease subunit S [Roseateles oligotrophus]MCV2366581.1 restriction endonuclease subunit S [Roseateles oligotrophus]